VLGAGCTEENPAADDETGSTSDETGSTTASTTMTTSASATLDTTASSTDPGTEESDGSTGTGTTVDDTGPADSSTGEPSCGGGTSVCVPAAPEGWEGPAALIDDLPTDPSPGCSGSYGVLIDEAFGMFVAGAQTCDCTCGGPTNPSCDVTLYRDNSAGCGTPTGTYNIGAGCAAGPTSLANSYWQAEAGPIEATCTPEPVVDIGTPQFMERHTVCASEYVTSEGCGVDEVCTPIPVAPFAATTCIYVLAEAECPADLGYDVQHDWHLDFADTRSCSECTCGVEGACTGGVTLLADNTCTGPLAEGTASIGGACIQVSSAIESAELSGFQANATCDPSGGELMGAAMATFPITVCCRE